MSLQYTCTKRQSIGGQEPGRARPVASKDRTAKNRVHVPHEDRRHAVQAEGANPELVLSARSAEGGLELVLLADTELHVSALKVQLREEAGAPSLVDELLNVGQGLHRALRDGVEAAVVLAESSRAIRLASEDDGCGVGGARRDNPAPVEQGRDLLAALVELAL